MNKYKEETQKLLNKFLLDAPTTEPDLSIWEYYIGMLDEIIQGDKLK